MIFASWGLALALSATAPVPEQTAPTAPTAPSARILRFVGEQVSFDRVDCIPKPRETRDAESTDGHLDPVDAGCTEDDYHYRVRYRVRTMLDGKSRDIVEFLATDWTSHYAESQAALLYVLESPEGTVLPSGLAISVYPTVDGEWASCDAETESEPVEFAGDVVFGRTDGMSAYGIAQAFPASDFVVIGSEAFCTRGRRLPALVEELERELADLREAEYPGLASTRSQAASP